MTNPNAAETITSAHYENPTTRYGHFALGRPHEYAQLTVLSSTGRQLTMALLEEEVFEDMAPRKIKLSEREPMQLLTIVSRRGQGARLVVVHLSEGRLEISAQSAAIGVPMRWLNPVGVFDLDGDGQAEIAAVITPHIGGTLKVYQRDGKQLNEVGAMYGFSNHVYGSNQLDLSTSMVVDKKAILLVPDRTRTVLRQIAWESKKLVETRQCPLSAPITGSLAIIDSQRVRVQLSSGPSLINVQDCTLLK